jgi:hypothetical protein
MAALAERFYGPLKKYARTGPGAHVVRARR